MKLHAVGISLSLLLGACTLNFGSSKADKDKEEASKDTDSRKNDSAGTSKAKSDDTAKPKEAENKAKEDQKAEKPGKESKPAVAGTEQQKTAANESAVKDNDLPAYPMSAIHTIDDSCASPWVVLANAPESVGESYEWKWTKQAVLANLEFHTTASEPAAEWQVTFEVHQLGPAMSNAYALIAHCHDGVTCNHLAAMYKATVKSSSPQLICGSLPSTFGPVLRHFDLLAGGPRANLPAESDAISLCARIGACTASQKPTATDDVGLACQKSPSNFKTDCARSFPCSEVMACLGR